VSALPDHEYPRVLVFGGGFDSYSGGGVTLSNLFREWPVSRLAVADSTAREDTAAVACAEYRLGTLERRWMWPLSRVPRRRGRSGPVERSDDAVAHVCERDLPEPDVAPASHGVAVNAASTLFHATIDRLGAEEVLLRTVLSEPLRAWVDEYAPDVIYCHFSTLHTLRLVRALHESSGARLAIHVMDDWPEIIYRRTLLGPWLRARIDRELRELLSRADVLMAISRAMADEYRARYGLDFEVFHNCIDIPWWKESRKASWSVSTPLTIVYSGRIGWDAVTSFRDVCEAVEITNRRGLAATFRVYSPDFDTSDGAALSRYPHTEVLPSIEHERLPSVLAGADVLAVPSGFEDLARRYARLSLPTKVPAYMASGTPILLYAPRTYATSAWAEQARWAFVVGDRGPARLAQALAGLAADPGLREALGRRATEIADREFDGERVRGAFREALAGRPSCDPAA
jgi:glycosyltransferase involved in cell wall biosynthesis